MPVFAGSPRFLALADVKAHINVTGSQHDAELTLIACAAEEAIEHLAGPVAPTTVTETLSTRTGRLLLRQWPILSVESVGAGEAHTLYPEAGIVTVAHQGTYEVTYTAGRTPVPAAITLAALIVAGHLWETQRGHAPSPFQPDDDVAVPGIGFALPNRAMDLLAPHLRPPVLA